MLIPSVVAARVCGVSRSFFLRSTKALGISPAAVDGAGSGSPARLWSATQVVAVLAAPQLGRLGVTDESLIAFVQGVAGTRDEQLEAQLADGRSWIMVVARDVCPDLLFKKNIVDAAKRRAAVLAVQGLALTGLNLGPLYADVARLARDQVAQPADDAR